ncbi:MAG TPA: hypothetical protein VLF61_04720 [Rhabdochlamydiaceae bacterium]|nr:hypothetical protein [Rhabdochlamydiaceae bacterium]
MIPLTGTCATGTLICLDTRAEMLEKSVSWANDTLKTKKPDVAFDSYACSVPRCDFSQQTAHQSIIFFAVTQLLPFGNIPSNEDLEKMAETIYKYYQDSFMDLIERENNFVEEEYLLARKINTREAYARAAYIKTNAVQKKDLLNFEECSNEILNCIETWYYFCQKSLNLSMTPKEPETPQMTDTDDFLID